MKRKHLATLVLGGMITTLHGEDFIDAGKEMQSFTKLYDFGTPMPSKHSSSNDSEASQMAIEENGSQAKNTTSPLPPEQEKQVLKNDLNITCGAKCGIPFFPDGNTSEKK